MTENILQKAKDTFLKSEDQIQAGLACLASVIRYYGGNVSVSKLYQAGGASQEKVTLLGLSKAAGTFDFEADGYRGNIENLKKLDRPVILHIEKESRIKDYVVLYGFLNNKFIVGDPQWGIVEYREDELEAFWKSKIYLVVKPGINFRSEMAKTGLKRDNLKKLLVDNKSIIFSIAVTGFIASTITILILPGILNYMESILAGQREITDIKSFVLTLLMLGIAAGTYSLNKKFIKQGVRCFLSGINKKIIKSLLYQNNFSVTMGDLQTMLNSARYFGYGTFRLFGTLPFLIPIVIASLIYILIASFVTGLILIITVILTGFLSWLRKKEYSQFLLQNYQIKSLEVMTIKEGVDAIERLKLTNSENILITSNGKILDLSEDIYIKTDGQKIKIKNRFYSIFCMSVLSIIAIHFFVIDIFFGYQGFMIAAWGIILFWSADGLQNCFITTIISETSYNYLYENFWDHEPVITNNEIKETENIIEEINNFSIEKISVSFPGRLPVVKEVNFHAEIGNLTAVFGNSGSGKTVLVSALCRLLPIASGDVKINGISWESFNTYQWRQNVTSVQQPASLFNADAIQNIGWGKPNVETEEIISFCEKMGFSRFIERFPNGYSTNINNISNSEAQLIALASGIYRKPKILLLDEPFLGMDEMLEQFCWQLIQQIKTEMIILIFTGRNELTKKADQVFMLENVKSVLIP